MSDLEHLLTVRARGRYANATMTMVAVGMNLFMSLYGLSVFLETPEPQRKGRKRYIAASFVMTVLFSLVGSLDMASYFQTLFKSTSPSHWKELVLQNSSDWKFLLGYTSVGLFIAVGDALLVYRCYIICVEYRWVTILPAITTMTGLGFFIAGVFLPSGKLSSSPQAISTFLTVSTNIFVTSLITFRLLRARHTLAKVLPSADMRVYTGVIAILIESAAPLSIFGIIAAIMQRLYARSNRSPGFYVSGALFEALFYSFCTLSPQMIIFRVTTGRSFTKFPTPKDGVLSNPIQFAHRTAEFSFFQSTFNREFGRTPDPDTERGLNRSIDESEESQTSVTQIGQGKREVEKAE